MAQSRYFQINPIRRQLPQTNDVQRGLQIGQEIGKLIGGVAGAVKSAQADAAANKLMNTAEAPRAALVSPGGTYQDTGGPQPASGGADPNADLSTDLPEDVSSQLSVQVPPDASMPSGTGAGTPQGGSAGYTYSGTAPDPVVGQNVAATSLSPQPSTTFVPNTIPAGVSTAGTKPFSGGVAGMKLQQEFQKSQAADQLQKLQLQKAQRDAVAAQQEDAGTGRFAVDAALKRAQLAEAQARVLNAGKPKTAAAPKEGPPTDINGEPVTSDTQLSKFVDGQYGNGTTAALTSMLADGSTDPAQETDANGKPVIDPTTGQPKMKSTVSVPLGKNKSATIPLAEAQTYTKQKNALRLKQNLPLFRVPGEDQSVGATANNPYQAKNKLDAMSRARGTWVKLPQALGGQTVQVGA